MRKLIIDRFEGSYAVCEDKDRSMFAIDKKEIPNEAKEGDILKITDSGEIEIDKQSTADRREELRKLQKDLWK